MEDPTKLDSSGDENKTAIKGNTTGDALSGDFVAGTILASRYRIIGMIGKGGMGEVYKAEDIKLSQTVALKFLPDGYQNDIAALDRFHAEARNARQVSHVNVCRVFDIGDVDGRHFLSMEFVDGDDLSALLTRVGRFTSERAVEIARQLCVGMEAIHQAGILHRDFKPGNIIINSRGVVRITDFGIAGLEADMKGDNIRAGTPAYMSPEQITGKEVTVRSDIYGLGLVIYEIFTGKQAFFADNVIDLIKKHQTETPTSASEIVKGIDPLVESVIAQCLEKDPNDRPQSALHVAMALPGGNPLQIALDAGQTPSPEMVAASPKKGALRPIVAVSLLASVIIGIIILMAASKQLYLNRMVPLDRPPEVLRERGRELVEKFGYRPVDFYSEFECFCGKPTYIDYLQKNDQTPERWQKLAAGQPATIKFLYRSSPEPLAPVTERAIRFDDPKNDLPGMALVRLDTKGRLIYFSGTPPRVDVPTTATGPFDWAIAFKEAGFDLAAFQPVSPQWTPPQAFDERRAFSGKYPDQPDVEVRIEAAAYHGKLVNFEIVEPWTKPGITSSGPPEGSLVGTSVVLLVYFGVLFISGWLAYKNISDSRSDIKGASRVAFTLFAVRMLVWALATHHIASFGEFVLLINGLQSALYYAAMAGFMYLAFEPYLRKTAPERVISWNRLLAGDWRDPLVGRDILIGCAGGSITIVLFVLLDGVFPILLGKPPALQITGPPDNIGGILAGVAGVPEFILVELSGALIGGFIGSFLILFLGLLLRRKWLGSLAAFIIIASVMVLNGIGLDISWFDITSSIFSIAVLIFVAARFGVLSFVALFLFVGLTSRPVTTDISAWYAGDFIVYVIVLVGLAIYGFYTSTAGQKLWQGKLLGEEG